MDNRRLVELFHVARMPGMSAVIDMISEQIHILESEMMSDSNTGEQQVRLVEQWKSARKIKTKIQTELQNAVRDYEEATTKDPMMRQVT